MWGCASSRNRDFFHGDVPHADQLAEVREELVEFRGINRYEDNTCVGVVECELFFFHVYIVPDERAQVKRNVGFICRG